MMADLTRIIMPHLSSLRPALVKFAIAGMPMFLPHAAQAQAGFVGDAMIASMCLIQNWDTSRMQTWLKEKPKKERFELYGAMHFSSNTKRCLMQSKPAPAALCDKVIEQFVSSQRGEVGQGASNQILTDEEQNKLFTTFNDAPCNFGDVSEGKDDWLPDDMKPNQSALDLLERAKKGDRAAQLAAIDLYTTGTEAPPNVEKADYWRTLAALNGDAASQRVLGLKYFYGRAPHHLDYEKAIKFFTMAAAQGNRDAMTSLGVVYQVDEPHYGQSHRKKDIVRAVDWFTKAADLGDGDAAFWLAQMYESGNTTLRADLAKALSWYHISAQHGNANSMLRLREYYRDGKAGKKDPKAAQKWLRAANAVGASGTTYLLADYFPWGTAPSDEGKVLSIQLDHAEAGDIDAQLAVAQRYFSGSGVGKDMALAVSWWRKAALMGDPIGQRMLGESLIDGLDPSSKDAKSAGVLWLQKAAAQGDAAAEAALGYWHIHLGGKDNAEKRRNTVEAVRWMRQAADHGYRPEDTRDRASKWEQLMDEEGFERKSSWGAWTGGVLGLGISTVAASCPSVVPAITRHSVFLQNRFCARRAFT
jgi:TPR repeat protein